MATAGSTKTQALLTTVVVAAVSAAKTASWLPILPFFASTCLQFFSACPSAFFDFATAGLRAADAACCFDLEASFVRRVSRRLFLLRR